MIKNYFLKRSQQGTIIPLIAIMLTAILGIGALVIDLSQAYSVQTRIKNAIDLSCLAGISQLTNQSNVAIAKNIALTYLNENLTMSLPSFLPLTLENPNLSLKVGVYDFNAMSFTWDEASPLVNSIMISYAYNSTNILGTVFMINSIQVSDKATSVKQIAGKMPPGGGFPIAIKSSVLTEAKANNNMFDLVQSGTPNSYFTAFDASTASASDIQQILEYFKNQSGGFKPPSLTVGEEFQINNGNLTTVYMTLDDSSFLGKTYISPVVNVNQNFSNLVTVEGFIGFTLNNIYMTGNDYHIAGTIIPGYVDNKWSGLVIGAGPGDIPEENQSLLASSYGLIE